MRTDGTPVVISAAVEGEVDEAVARKLVCHVGGRLGTVYGKGGKPSVLKNLKGYDNAGRRSPWFVLVDLDRDRDCAPLARAKWLPRPASRLCFRIAVREVEAWVMADAETLAGYLGVARKKVPADTESLDFPKTALVNLARRSRRKRIREDMVPRHGSGRQAGPAYVSRLIEYVDTTWRPDVAARHADSLQRAIACLRRLVEGHRDGGQGS